jgi:hypothetical protein
MKTLFCSLVLILSQAHLAHADLCHASTQCKTTGETIQCQINGNQCQAVENPGKSVTCVAYQTIGDGQRKISETRVCPWNTD